MKIRTRARKQLKPSKPAINQVSTVSDNAKDYVSFLDPQKICVGTIPNRHADSYDAESFESLRLSIQCAGGNVQPIRVYSLDAAKGQQFVLIYGERRLRACQELGLPVRAVVTHAQPEKQRFFDTVRENQSRADLSAVSGWPFHLEIGKKAGKHSVHEPNRWTLWKRREWRGANTAPNSGPRCFRRAARPMPPWRR